MSMVDVDELRRRFRDLHGPGADGFLLPNPWDVPSARLLESLGAIALATTSSGFAATLGRLDQHVTLDEVVDHVGRMTAAVDLPVSVDAEDGYADTPAGVAVTVERIAGAGAAGLSIEDFDPQAGTIRPLPDAVDRIEAAAEACHRHGMVLTGRAENLIRGGIDLDDTIARLIAYRDAGATALFAPGLLHLADVERVVEAVGAPLNVLALPGGPAVDELIGAGVRRISTGGGLAWTAYGAMVAAASDLFAGGGAVADGRLTPEQREAAFDA